MKLIILTIALIYICFSNISAQQYTFDFEQDLQGWKPDFADYNIGDSANWNLSWSHEIMPNVAPQQKGIFI